MLTPNLVGDVGEGEVDRLVPLLAGRVNPVSRLVVGNLAEEGRRVAFGDVNAAI
jgi:hypothetical protein